MAHRRSSSLPIRLLLVAVFACLLLPARLVAAEPDPAAAGLIEAHGFAAEDVGYALFDPADGTMVYGHNLDRPYIPASVAKVPTAVAALAVLGPDHRFTTALLGTGTIEDGVLKGALVLRGGGDPFLSTDHLAAMAKALRALGVQSVAGGFLYDESWLGRAERIDTRQPDAAGYNTGVSALSVNFNRIQLRWTRTAGSAIVGAHAVSEGHDVPAVWIAVEDGGDRGFPVVRTPAGWRLGRELPNSGRQWVPVRDPGAHAAQLFRVVALEAGIDLPPPARGAVPPGAEILVTHDSLPLSEILTGILRYSNNMSAELVGMATSRALTGMPLTPPLSAAVLADWWREQLPGVDWTGFGLESHSGLSSTTKLTPAQMAAILEAADTLTGDTDISQLMAAVRWEDAPEDAQGLALVRAKTGTMSFASGLGGYLRTDGDRRLGFVVFVNDTGRRAAMEADFDARRLGGPEGSGNWTGRARALQEALVRHWLADDMVADVTH